MTDIGDALRKIESAAAAGRLSPGAVENIRAWLVEPRYAQYAPLVVEHIDAQKWRELDDAFWTVIPFGTGGRRGKMYPIGTNAINDRTIGESAQGLADYVREQHTSGEPLACAIAYDTRHRSRQFAELCAEVMVAAGFQVYFLDGYRSTPELSLAVRYKACACGIMVTASHNPPSDNAVKAYWSTGGQLLPPHDRGVIDRVMHVENIERVPFERAVADGRVTFCQSEVDRRYIGAVLEQAAPGPRDLKILYSPLHGVGASAVCPVLEEDGFKDVELYGPHAKPSGDFPNVPGHVSNPENPAVFDGPIETAKQQAANLVLATDPDADRIGCAAPLSTDADAAWQTLDGNQIAALLTDFVLSRRRVAGSLSPRHYIVKTLVTTDLMRRIADSYGVKTYGDLLVGFKWIGGVIDEVGPEHFVCGAEESHGYLCGTHVRDKDAAVAAMQLAELAADLKSQNKTLHGRLDDLYRQHGLHHEDQVSITLPGAEGMQQMRSLMARLRQQSPSSLAGLPVVGVRDYLNQVRFAPGGPRQPLAGPRGDLVMLDLDAETTYVAVRPSGTEPKIKLYIFTYAPPAALADLPRAKMQLRERASQLACDLKSFLGT